MSSKNLHAQRQKWKLQGFSNGIMEMWRHHRSSNLLEFGRISHIGLAYYQQLQVPPYYFVQLRVKALITIYEVYENADDGVST